MKEFPYKKKSLTSLKKRPLLEGKKRKLSMIYLKASPRGCFWNLLEQPPTSAKFFSYDVLWRHKISPMPWKFRGLKLTYPILKNFKALFWTLNIIHNKFFYVEILLEKATYSGHMRHHHHHHHHHHQTSFFMLKFF